MRAGAGVMQWTRTVARCCAVVLMATAGCLYQWDTDPIALGEGDITGVMVGVPPGEISVVNRGLAGGRVRVEKSVLTRSAASDGRFVLRNMPEGTHTLLMTYDPNRDGVPDLARQVRVPIRIPPRQSKRSYVNMGDVELLPPGTIRGRVEAAGGPAGVLVVLASSEYRAVPDPVTGVFEIRGVGEGDWEIVAARSGLMSPTRSLHVPSGEVVELGEPLRLVGVADNGTVQGEITEASVGAAVTSSSLQQALGSVQSKSLHSMTDAKPPIVETDGSAELFMTVPPGIYLLVVEGDFIPLRLSAVVVLPGVANDLGQLVVAPVPADECLDLDGDGLCFAEKNEYCAHWCREPGRVLHEPCSSPEGPLDCDDDADGQADAEEMLGSLTGDPACTCPLGEPMTSSMTCESDPDRADRDWDGLCDLLDPFPHCRFNREPCMDGQGSDGGVPDSGAVDAGVDDAATDVPDAAELVKDAAVVDASVNDASVEKPDAGEADAAKEPPDAGAIDSGGGFNGGVLTVSPLMDVADIAVTKDGHVVMAGHGDPSLQLTCSSAPFINPGTARFGVVVAFAPGTWDCVWAATLESTEITLIALTVDGSDNVFVAGNGIGALTVNSVLVEDNAPVYVARLDANGRYLDATSLSGVGDIPRGGMVPVDRGVWVTGTANSDVLGCGRQSLPMTVGSAFAARLDTATDTCEVPVTLLPYPDGWVKVHSISRYLGTDLTGQVSLVGTFLGSMTIASTQQQLGSNKGIGMVVVRVTEPQPQRFGVLGWMAAEVTPYLPTDQSAVAIDGLQENGDGQVLIHGRVDGTVHGEGAPPFEYKSFGRSNHFTVVVAPGENPILFSRVHGDILDLVDGRIEGQGLTPVDSRSRASNEVVMSGIYRKGLQHEKHLATSSEYLMLTQTNPVLSANLTFVIKQDSAGNVNGGVVLRPTRGQVVDSMKLFDLGSQGWLLSGNSSGILRYGIPLGCDGALGTGGLQYDLGNGGGFLWHIPPEAFGAPCTSVPDTESDDANNPLVPVSIPLDAPVSRIVDLTHHNDLDCYSFMVSQGTSRFSFSTQDLTGSCSVDTVVSFWDNMSPVPFVVPLSTAAPVDDTVAGPCATGEVTASPNLNYILCVSGYAGMPIPQLNLTVTPMP